MDNTIASVITVTYNNEGNICGYLKSLKKSLSIKTEVVIVDNASNDNTVNLLEKEKGIILIKSKENLGFSKACNLAAKRSKGKYLFFLNPDTKITKFVIEKLINFSEQTDDAGIVAPKLIQFNGLVQASVRKFPSLKGAVKEYYFGIRNSFDAYVPSGMEAISVDAVVGAAMLIKKEIFEKVGGFEEYYFMYYEDIDLCKRIKELNLKVYYLPDVAIYHTVGGSQSVMKSKWLKESARIYHGLFGEMLLYAILRLRHILELIRNSLFIT